MTDHELPDLRAVLLLDGLCHGVYIVDVSKPSFKMVTEFGIRERYVIEKSRYGPEGYTATVAKEQAGTK